MIISISLTYQSLVWLLTLVFNMKEEKFEYENKVYIKIVKVLAIVAIIQTIWTVLDILFSL